MRFLKVVCFSVVVLLTSVITVYAQGYYDGYDYGASRRMQQYDMQRLQEENDRLRSEETQRYFDDLRARDEAEWEQERRQRERRRNNMKNPYGY